MVLPWSNIHNLVKIVPHLVVRSAAALVHCIPSIPFFMVRIPSDRVD